MLMMFYMEPYIRLMIKMMIFLPTSIAVVNIVYMTSSCYRSGFLSYFNYNMMFIFTKENPHYIIIKTWYFIITDVNKRVNSNNSQKYKLDKMFWIFIDAFSLLLRIVILFLICFVQMFLYLLQFLVIHLIVQA